MSPSFTETVTVERPGAGGTDQWGQKVPGTEHTVVGCVFAPRAAAAGQWSSTEVHAQRNTVITGLVMYAPAGADIGPHDVIRRADGVRWQVEGEPGVWVSPFSGWAPGVEVTLERVTG